MNGAMIQKNGVNIEVSMLGTRIDVATLAQTNWDLVVIGGGITGAGVLLEALRQMGQTRQTGQGKKVLLLEQKDFAWGTSSRSSKMVHGGIRYMAQGDFRLVRESLHERERLLTELPDLVVRQPYLFVVRARQFPSRWAMKPIMWLYDRFAGIRDHQWWSISRLTQRVPQLDATQLKGAMYYTDALVDDARLVLRVLHEAVLEGGQVCNYMRVNQISAHDAGGFELDVRDELSQSQSTLRTQAVVNATGAQADELSGTQKKVRPCRGSHLLIEQARLPMIESLTILHPRDQRPVFVYPWMGMTCIGTTDLDHTDDLAHEARCTDQEVDYLLELMHAAFPTAQIVREDIVSSFAGVRPIIASGKGVHPSQERRSHSVWTHHGVVTVSGGKLTTFRVIAHDVLRALGWVDENQQRVLRDTHERLFRHDVIFPNDLGNPKKAIEFNPAFLQTIEWVMQHEMVVHLDDVLLRRTRFGNTQRNGGYEYLPQIRTVCQKYLAWNDARWDAEQARYLEMIQTHYSPPKAPTSILDE